MEVQKIILNDEIKLELERLAALGYRIEQMAMYFDFPVDIFRQLAADDTSEVAYHIKRGKLTIKVNADAELLKLVEKGNITAIQQLQKREKENLVKDLLDTIIV